MRFRERFLSVAAVLAMAVGGDARGQEDSPWADWVEPDVPFFSSVLDCRDLGEGFPNDNLVPRGLILNLGNHVWACYDVDLLRIACIWQAEPGKPPITMNALAPGSYHVAGQKTKDGQDDLPKPMGKVLLVNGVYPGWQMGEAPSLKDPREPAPSGSEVGRGGMGPNDGDLMSVGSHINRPGLEYLLAGVKIREVLLAESADVVRRYFEVGAVSEPLVMMLDEAAEGESLDSKGEQGISVHTDANGQWLRLEPRPMSRHFQIARSADGKWQVIPSRPLNASGWISSGRWPELVKVSTSTSKATGAASYEVEKIPLPIPNPWKRNVRLADVDFLDDQGHAVGVTMDGDVWKISGLKDDLKEVTWRRFATGLHEPMSIVVREGEPFVFDRNGIWRLIDQDGDGVVDRHEMFCNLFAQTAETREFPMSMKLGPEGAFFISKGGQQGTTLGKHNGSAIRVAPDGKSFEVIAYGLRQPFIGVNPVTGLVTASDQQGHYVPSTPIHILKNHQFYGFLPDLVEEEAYPEAIAEPLTWIPHPVNSSGATQVWALDKRFGPVAEEMIHVGYNRPELFRVVMNSRFERPQAAVMSFTRDLDFGPLNAKMNPADGQLYVAGFQVWGTTGKELSGLARVRYTGGDRPLVKEVTPMDKGVLLTFNMKLDPTVATDPANYSAERWNYRRTPKYGSPHLKLDGSAGQEWMTASSAYLSEDGLKVLVGFPDMQGGIDQMRIGWGIQTATGVKAQNAAYFSPWELATFDGDAEGFGDIEVDLTPRKPEAMADAVVSAEEGEKLYQMFGCMACHSTDGTLQGKVGPSWKGLYGSEREIAKGDTVKADEAYLKESILNPSAKVVKGFEKFDTGMPIYEGILNAAQVDSLVLYIKALELE